MIFNETPPFLACMRQMSLSPIISGFEFICWDVVRSNKAWAAKITHVICPDCDCLVISIFIWVTRETTTSPEECYFLEWAGRDFTTIFFFCLSLLQQGRKGSFCSLTWFPTSSSIIVTNNPWLRLVLTMATTALILVMAVFNMVRNHLQVKKSWTTHLWLFNLI